MNKQSNLQIKVIVIGLVLSLLAICPWQNALSQQSFGQPSVSQANISANLDDKEAIAAQNDQAIKREITVEARVKKLLPTDTQGLPHQKFLIILSNDTTILIAHDLKFAPSVPIKPGDVVRIHGEYIWNKLGGLIHWTHHSDTPRHDNGWIEFNGQRYQ